MGVIHSLAPVFDPAVRPRDYGALGTGMGLGTMVKQAWEDSPLTGALDENTAIDEARYGARIPFRGRGGFTGPREEPSSLLLDPEQATAKYGIKGELTFDAPVREAEAEILYRRKREDMRRADVLARAESGFIPGAARLGAAFVGSALDPVNVASAFIPVVGPARYAIWAARYGRTAARAGRGVIEGAVGAAAVEPLYYSQAQLFQQDYDATDSLLNIAFGTALGGGLHVGGGAVGDLVSRAGHATRDAALRASVAAITEGRPVDVAPLLREVPRAAPEAPRAIVPRAAGNRVYTAGGQSIEVAEEVVEASSLIASHGADFERNAAFPSELQPRQRDRAAAQQQVREIASNLQPERLGSSPSASDGAPIIGPDGVVESGNGRVMALRTAYQEGNQGAASYREFLKARGFDVEGMAEPVLVRRRTTELTPDQRRAFTVEAQDSGTLKLSATETAMADARAIPDSMIDLYRGGDPISAGNRPFVRAFIASLPQSEQGRLVDAAGELSQEGERRIRGALLARAYGDANIVASLIESADTDIKAIGGALLDAAGPWAKMRAEARAGILADGVDATDELLAAVRLVQRARRDGVLVTDLLAQNDMFAEAPPAQRAFVSMMFRDPAMKRPKGREALAGDLIRYAEEARKTVAGPSLFGDAMPAVRPEDLMQGRQTSLLPEDATTIREIDERAGPVVKAKPQEPEAEAAEIEAELADLQTRLDEELAGGRLTEADAAEVRDADEGLAAAEAEGVGARVAALCLARAA